MKKEKFDIKVKQIIEQYKKNLAILMRKGHACEVVALLNDSGTLFTKDKSMYDIAKKTINATCVEELEVQRVNFVFSLLNKNEREIIANEFLLNKPSIWWNERFARSTYYRNRRNACKKFVEYYGLEKK